MQRLFLSLVPMSLVLGLFLLSGCSNADSDLDANQNGKGQIDGKLDRWTNADDPHLFSDSLEVKLDALPLEGEAVNIPWASSYWPVYEDSINYRWAGEESLSPAAKYGAAFSVEDIEDKVSANHGVDSMTTAKE
mgnify:CR=1 FL=1